MGKTSLVIGCSGQDGSLLCKSLIKNNENVIGITRDNSREPENHKKIGIGGEVKVHQVSIENLSEVINFLKKNQPDHIYNFSAQSSVGKSFDSPFETHKSIVGASSNLLEACKVIGFDGKIFFSGSSEIFGETPRAANLKSKINIKSPYAASKYQSLILAKMYKEIYGINVITGIFFNHESPLRNENFVTQKIIRGAIKCKKNNNLKISMGNLEIARDWGWAEEFIEGVKIIMNSHNNDDQIICTGRLTSLKEFIQITFSFLGLNWQDHIISDKKYFRKTDIKQSFGDPTKMKEDLGWKSKVHIKDIIERLIYYHLRKR